MSLSRGRRSLPVLFLALLVALLPACGSGAEEAAPAAQSFSFTDARGEKIDLPARPTRIVADEASASALIPRGIRPVAIWSASAPSASPTLAGLDLTGIESAGEVYGELNVEKIAALRPDLVITGYYPSRKQYGGINPDDTQTVENLRRLAPIATIDATQPASAYITAFGDLAGRLGADLQNPAVTAARGEYEQAVTAFRAAVAAKPGLTVSAVAPSDQVYIANPPDFAEFRDYTGWGLRMQVPAGSTPESYFGTVGWESAASGVTGDVLLLDARPGSPTNDDLKAQNPTWSLVKGVKSNAIAPWVTDTFTNYPNYTRQLRELTAVIERATPAPTG